MRVHFVNQSVNCPVCRRVLKNTLSLRNHLRLNICYKYIAEKMSNDSTEPKDLIGDSNSGQ